MVLYFFVHHAPTIHITHIAYLCRCVYEHVLGLECTYHISLVYILVWKLPFIVYLDTAGHIAASVIGGQQVGWNNLRFACVPRSNF